MNLTKEQREMLHEIWIVLKDKLVEVTGKTRSKDMDINYILNTIKNDTLKLFITHTEKEANIAMQFIDFVIDTVITTKSLARTITKVDIVYQFSII